MAKVKKINGTHTSMIGVCKYHGEYTKDVEDSPCPTCEDNGDICCVCGETGEYGTMQDVNETDFELLCENCRHCRCSNCLNCKNHSFRLICEVHDRLISDPINKVCDSWKSV